MESKPVDTSITKTYTEPAKGTNTDLNPTVAGQESNYGLTHQCEEDMS